MAGNNKGVQEEALNAPASFDRVVMPASSARNMSEGEEVVVRVNVTNANDNVFTKVNLLVDSFELVKVTDSDVRPARQAAKPEKESVTTQQGTPGEEEISYSNNSGAVLIKVEAEKARSQGNVVDDQQASRGKAVQLAGKGSYVEYEINFPETDMYSLDFQGKSEDLDQRPSTARIILDGKKLFGNDEKLESNPSYAYYTSERKVFVEKGRHTFRVEFVNPGAKDEGERALVVDYLKIRGMRLVGPISPPLASPGASFTAENPDPNSQIFQAENASLCQSSREKTICEDGAVSDYTAYGGRALTLNRKGDFVEAEFHVTTPGSYSVGASLRSLDYYGSAKADIFIDGDKVAGNVTPSTQGYKPSFMYTKTFKANTRHKIKVVYVNDLCGTKSEDCTLENDRNLLVDQLRVSLVNEEPSNNRVSQQLLRNTASAIREQ